MGKTVHAIELIVLNSKTRHNTLKGWPPAHRHASYLLCTPDTINGTGIAPNSTLRIFQPSTAYLFCLWSHPSPVTRDKWQPSQKLITAVTKRRKHLQPCFCVEHILTLFKAALMYVVLCGWCFRRILTAIITITRMHAATIGSAYGRMSIRDDPTLFPPPCTRSNKQGWQRQRQS